MKESVCTLYASYSSNSCCIAKILYTNHLHSTNYGPYLETAGAALVFPRVSGIFSSREMVGRDVYFHVLIAPLESPQQHGGGAGSD